MQLELAPEAAAEIDEATDWYIDQDVELGIRFALEVERMIEAILDNPRAWTMIEPGVRRTLLREFPYAVVYRVVDDRVQVIAVMHQHRDPGYWRRRL
jgi:toxin ParE1/3/4